jgi:hypothetical protein
VLFSHQLTAKILELRKTETRQRVQPGQAGAQRKPCYYRVGSNYALQRPMRLSEADELQAAIIEGRRRGRPPRKEVGRILITGVDRGPLGDVDFDIAHAEGFKTPTAFKAYWVRMHDGRWIRREEETTAPETGTVDVNHHLTDEDLAERFDERWRAAEVYVIRFKLESTTFYLAARPNRHGDYVTAERDEHGRQVAMTSTIETDPSAPEPTPPGVPTWSHQGVLHVPEEAVSPHVVDGWEHDDTSTHQQIKQDIRAGRKTGADYHNEQRRRFTVEQRIKAATAQARQRSAAVNHEIYIIRQAQKHKRTPRHIERLVEALERKANPAEAHAEDTDAA